MAGELASPATGGVAGNGPAGATSQAGEVAGDGGTGAAWRRAGAIFLLDLGCVQPFYCAYLCRALLEAGAGVTLGSIRYHLDRDFFAARELETHRRAAFDWIGRLGLRGARWRRPLKALEYSLNLTVWSVGLLARRPRVVHAQQLALADAGLPLDRWALGWAKRLGTRVVHTVHNLTPHDSLPGRSADRRRREFARLYRAADALICHDERARQALIGEFGILPERVFVIPHGLIFHEQGGEGGAEDRRRWDLRDGDCVFLFQGFIKPYKGLDWLLEGWKRGRQRGLDRATLIIAGTGDAALVADLRRQVMAAELGESVRLISRYLGADEVNSLYRAADVAVYPYREITSSGAVMTGVGHGKAIVATDLPLFRGLLERADAALFATCDDSDSLADVLVALAADPQRRERLQAGARELAQSVDSWTSIARATLRVYQAAAGSGRVPPEGRSEGRWP